MKRSLSQLLKNNKIESIKPIRKTIIYKFIRKIEGSQSFTNVERKEN